jgi:hypothetical protein
VQAPKLPQHFVERRGALSAVARSDALWQFWMWRRDPWRRHLPRMESAPLEASKKHAASHISDASSVLLLLLQQSSKQVCGSRVREAWLFQLWMKAHDHLEKLH